MLPGDLVTSRIRWEARAHRVGLVICNERVGSNDCGCLVLWGTGAGLVELRWELADQLTVIETEVEGATRRPGIR